jgi:hypothetical protein
MKRVKEIKRRFHEESVEELSIDMGGIKDHYCSNMTRTVVLGEPTEGIEIFSEYSSWSSLACFIVVGDPIKEGI